MDRYEEMESFVRVVDAGSITKAAEQLGVVKSAVSRRLADLEARLGVQLLTRSTRRLTLTETGQAFYDQSLRLLSDLEEVESAVSASSQVVKGRLAIAAPLSFGLMHFMPVINAFIERYPEVAIDLDLSDRQINLVEDNIDVAVRLGELQDSQLIARKLFEVDSVVCASPDFWDKHGVPNAATDLNALPMLRYSFRRAHELGYHDPAGKPGAIRPGFVHSANNGEALRDLATAGHGFVVIPVFLVCDALAQGTLVPVLRDHVWNNIHAYAVYPSTKHLSHRVRAFIDFLVETYKKDRPWEGCLGSTPR